MVFSTLALLYPDFDLTQHFQVDHVFPKGFFKPSNLNIKTKKKIAKICRSKRLRRQSSIFICKREYEKV